MDAIRGAIENTVSISLFNKGLAGRIFLETETGQHSVVPLSSFLQFSHQPRSDDLMNFLAVGFVWSQAGFI